MKLKEQGVLFLAHGVYIFFNILLLLKPEEVFINEERKNPKSFTSVFVFSGNAVHVGMSFNLNLTPDNLKLEDETPPCRTDLTPD